MKKSKFSLLLILTLVLSMFLAACSGGDEDTGSKPKDDGDKEPVAADVPQELRLLESAEIPTMDSVMATDTMGFTMLNNVNEGLYRQDQDSNLVPAVADGEPEMSEDGKKFTVKLKSDVKWSNGDPLTANDFVFAWQRAIDPATASEYGPYMMDGKIKGAKEIVQAGADKKPYDVKTLGIKAVDETTLEIETEKPMTVEFFKGLMAFGTFLPQNQKFVEEQGDKYAATHENLLYNGPFKMTNWTGPTATEWVLEKNENYHAADDVTLTKLTFNVVKEPQAAVNAFEANEADVTSSLGSDLVATYEGDERMVQYLEPVLWYLKINQTKTPALKNVNIRKAISMSFNKEDLTSSVLANGSIPANYAVPKDFVKDENGKDFRDANGDLTEYNPEKAKEYWAKGLEELGVKTIEIGYLGGDTETGKKMDEYMIDQMQTNLEGLTVKLESVPFAVRLDKDTKQDYDLQSAGWGPDYLDPISFSDLWVTDGPNNHMGYSNPAYDKAIEDANNETDQAKRWALLQEAEKILMEDAAIAPTYQRATSMLVAPKVEGIVNHNVGPEFSYQWVKITDAE